MTDDARRYPDLLTDELRDWLLDTDPALRWQVERDLLDAPEEVWQATRARTGTEGIAARLLALQDENGQWAGGSHFPTREDPRALTTPGDEDGQPWTSTSWSLSALRDWGVDPALLAGTVEKLAATTWEFEEMPFWAGEVDACINGWTLANGAWLGADVAGIATWFVEHQRAEGGWNCEWVEGSTRASVHSTLNALTGILSYEEATGGTRKLRSARWRAQEYLLGRRLLYASSGEQLGPWVGRQAYPFRWLYTALRATDHLRAAAVHDGVAPDPRAADAIALVRAGADAQGRWTQERRFPGQVWFEVDVPVGEASPWLTFHALRVLRWWDGAQVD